MRLDSDNNIVKLCAQGMNLEGEENGVEALRLFLQAWNESTNDFEKFISAHYIARHQKTVADKLKWDQICLNFALKINDEDVQDAYPSLYLNIARDYEDLNDFENARKNYLKAFSFSKFLPDDGYGEMIKRGISRGIERVT